MRFRALLLALASASSALPNGAYAADDFCSRLIVRAVTQFCQLLPNGMNLCQPVALVGPGPECATPERQAMVTVPLGPPTLQPPTPWGTPYASGSWPTAAASFRSPAQQIAAVPPTAPTPPDLPRIMPAAPKPGAAVVPARPLPPVAPSAPVATAPVAAAAQTPSPAPAPTIAPAAVPAASAAPATQTPATAPVAAKPLPAAPPVAEAPSATSKAAAGSARTAATQAATTAEEAADALAHFDFDSATLTAAGRATLDAWLSQAPREKPVRVSGHADRLGPEPYNLNLSLRRAEAVKQYLVGKGVTPGRIQLEAKGEAEPLKRCKGAATPATKACLAPNRRVEIDLE